MTLPMNSSLVVAGRPEWRPDGAPELIAGRAAKRRFSGWTGAGVPDDRAAQYGFQAEGEAAFQDVGVVAGEARGSEDDDWHGSDQVTRAGVSTRPASGDHIMILFRSGRMGGPPRSSPTEAGNWPQPPVRGEFPCVGPAFADLLPAA